MLYFVPVIVSDGREVTDKAGKSSLVFDTIFNPSIRARITSDADFKTFITARREKSGLVLGREIATPNIKSKGALESRSVLIPAYWSPETASTSPSSTPLVQEISTRTSNVLASIPPPSSAQASSSATGIALKTSTSSAKPPAAPSNTKQTPLVPTWAIEIENKGPGSRVARITVQLPLMKRPDHANTTLDIERNRLILSCPPSYSVLDVPILDPSSESRNGKSASPTLPPQDSIVQESILVVTAPVVSTVTPEAKAT
ncbi:hypothetical protein BS47DRAFT_1344148 [Hydnum rufescens UP504]|uniref:PIH1 N-terminal domain-containing protein n=1 Tax=Hydnum rufescens UP504 TaxID=1448309 RepID=A0A9P6AX32_9AGAM|nr:hypothetical protein BS47DRAFT_1344148 [Hydnum rufescens UP504]